MKRGDLFRLRHRGRTAVYMVRRTRHAGVGLEVMLVHHGSAHRRGERWVPVSETIPVKEASND